MAGICSALRSRPLALVASTARPPATATPVQIDRAASSEVPTRNERSVSPSASAVPMLLSAAPSVPAPDAPCLLLKSRAQLAFRNKADQDSDPDYNEGLGPTALADAKITITDLVNDGTFTSPGESARIAIPGDRSHRVDVVSFFARGNFKRQTGGDVGGGGVGDEEDPLSPLIADTTARPPTKSPLARDEPPAGASQSPQLRRCNLGDAKTSHFGQTVTWSAHLVIRLGAWGQAARKRFQRPPAALRGPL